MTPRWIRSRRRGAYSAWDIRARVRAINKALRIVTELSGCLNHEAGGSLSRNLAGLYGYVMRLLIEANIEANRSAAGRSGGPAVHLAGGMESLRARRSTSSIFQMAT